MDAESQGSGRKSRRRLSDSARKERKRILNRKMDATRVYVGSQYHRLLQLKSDIGAESCPKVVKILLDRYDNHLCIGTEHERWKSLAKLTNLTDEQLAGVLLDCYEKMAGAEIPRDLRSQETTGKNMPEKDSPNVRCIKTPDCGKATYPPTQIWDDDSGDSGKEESKDDVSRSDENSDEGHGDVVLTRNAKNYSNDLPNGAVSIKMEIEDDGYNPCAVFHNPLQPSDVKAASDVCKRGTRHSVGCDNVQNEDCAMDSNSDFSECEGDVDDDKKDLGFAFTKTRPVRDWKAETGKGASDNYTGQSEKLETVKEGLGYKEDVKKDPDFAFSETGEIRGVWEKAINEKPKSSNDANVCLKSSLAKKGLRVKYVEKRRIRKGHFQLDDQLGSVLSEMFQPFVEVVHADDTNSENNTNNNSEPDVSRGVDNERQSPSSAGDMYRCKACDFTSKCLLSVCDHVEEVELYDPCVCSECGEMLPNKCQLNSHKRQVHENFVCAVPKRYRCSHEGCTFTNKSPGIIEKHVATVHENKREYPCTWEGCGKWFKQPYALRIHMRIHTDDKPIACSLCDFRCRQKASLNWHMKSKHSTDTDLSVDKN